jgi:hypothetical protein
MYATHREIFKTYDRQQLLLLLRLDARTGIPIIGYQVRQTCVLHDLEIVTPGHCAESDHAFLHARHEIPPRMPIHWQQWGGR